MRRFWVKYVSKFILRIGVIVVVLAAGVGARAFLASLKKDPAQAEGGERAVPVEVLEVHPETVPVRLEGYGVARSLNVVDVAPEVAGRIVAIHPRLETGEIIPEGELLFEIDPRDYAAALAQAEAQVAIFESATEQLQLRYETDQKRIGTLRRSRSLAKNEFDRLRNLLSRDQVGTQSGVDRSEAAYNITNDVFDLLEQELRLYPIRIKEAKSNQAGASAQRDRAVANLERCTVTAPFDARLQMVNVEKDQYAQPGVPLLTLADDSLLEITVRIQSKWMRAWLQFDDTAPKNGQAWFAAVEPVTCKVRWTDIPGDAYWLGTLHRVERFISESVTTSLAVRVTGEEATSGRGGAVPLVDGMFCSVEIPGKMMKEVYKLPPWAVSFEGEVYLSENKKLVRRMVTVLREQDGASYVSAGLDPGDLVITTRLVNPMPGIKLQHAEVTDREPPP